MIYELVLKRKKRAFAVVLEIEEHVEEATLNVDDSGAKTVRIHSLRGQILSGMVGIGIGDSFLVRTNSLKAVFYVLCGDGHIKSDGAFEMKKHESV